MQIINSHPFDDDKLHDECGVFGIFGSESAGAHCALGLHALQHRGQEAAGIISSDGGHFYYHKALGHVGDNFNSKDVIDELKGDRAIGHVRYSTAGEKNTMNVQPIFAEFSFGGVAFAHNGNLTNANALRKELIKEGAIFQSTMDTEIFIHLFARSKKQKVVDRMVEAMQKVKGAYSLVALSKKKLIGVRDPNGVRPLSIGKLGESYIFASETVAFDIIGAEFVRDVEPGEVVVIDNDGIQSAKPFENNNPRFCIFEYVYFSRPDSVIDGRHVYNIRQNIGAELAKESQVDADIVVPVPDSGVASAIGFAKASGIPFEMGIIRNHYVGRTFIEPTDQVRNLGVKLKHNANSSILKGKRVVLVDDSIVRGTTSRKIVNMVREAGAKEVHMCIASPPTTHSCFYGIDTPEQDKLIAHKLTIDEIAKEICVDSLTYLSLDGLYRATGEEGRNKAKPQFCDACFSGDYAIELVDQNNGDTCLDSIARKAK